MSGEDPVPDVDDGSSQFGVVVDLGGDLGAAVDDGFVVPLAQFGADMGEGEGGILSHDVHGDLASGGDGLVPLATYEGIDGEVEGTGDGIEDLCRGDVPSAAIGGEVDECLGGEFDGGGGFIEACVGDHPVERALEFADILLYLACDKGEHLGGYLGVLLFGLGAEDGQPGFQVRGLDIGDEAPFES